MTTPQHSAGQSFSLFPSPESSRPPPFPRNQTPKPRRSESRDRTAVSPESANPARHASPTPPRNNGRQTPQSRTQTPVDFNPASRQDRAPAWPLDTRVQHQPPVQQPRPANDVPVRSETAFSEANTLVRSNSGRSRSSIAKLPFPDDPSSSSGNRPQPLRSIFPTYNPEVSLDRQEYVPTQMSPSRIPRAVISRQTYHGDPNEEDEEEEEPTRGRPVRSPVRSPMSIDTSGQQWPPRAARNPPTIPKPCSTEQLKSLWKVTNGWKASSSEGRVYCMKLAQERDAPVYTLSSSSAQPFYNIRLDPTSVSAYVTVTRHDPSKPYKAPKAKQGTNSSSSSIRSGHDGATSSTPAPKTDGKHWHEALNTTLEEESRKHPPNDGLVALLMPTPATRMALEKADDPSAVFMAERECARLVWDEDSGSHFLVHPALATPFCVTVERSPAWSRTEYTLEHHESPQHLAKLTRDGTGGGWIELDTGIASKIESFYIIDVAVTALLLVAAADERKNPQTMATATESFEPPPAPAAAVTRGREGGALSKLGFRDDKKRKGKMEEFEIDVESQDESLGKGRRKEKAAEDKLPFLIRVIVKLAKGLFKCFIFILTVAAKCVGCLFKGCYSCVGSKY